MTDHTTDRATDHEALTRLIARYCHCLDDGRWDEFADLWAPDAQLLLRGETTHGRDAIRAAVESSQPPERRGRHLALNVELDIDGDTADGLCDFVFFVRSSEGRPKPLFLGRYVDAMVRTEGTWRFARRQISFF